MRATTEQLVRCSEIAQPSTLHAGYAVEFLETKTCLCAL